MNTLSSRGRGTLRGGVKIAAGIAGGLLLIYFLLAITSDSPLSAMQGLFTGAFSSPGRLAQWLSYSSFLMLTGASVCLAFRVGMFSIGAEGQVFVGALLSGFCVLTLGPSPWALPLAIVTAIVGGFLWGLIPGLMKAYLGADEIVTTLMMNYIGTFLFAFVIKEFLKPADAGYPVSPFFDKSSWFPVFGKNPGISSTLIMGILVCVIVSVLLNRTRFGYALRSVGDSPRFAHANGLKVPRLVWLSIAISGGIAGLAGAAIAFGSTDRLIIGMATGLGFDGILVALLALNRPALVPLTALAYGFFRTGGDVIQITANVPRDVIVIVQGIVILALAAAIRHRELKAKQAAAPSAPTEQPEAPPASRGELDKSNDHSRDLAFETPAIRHETEREIDVSRNRT